jgi:hypothetical protein
MFTYIDVWKYSPFHNFRVGKRQGYSECFFTSSNKRSVFLGTPMHGCRTDFLSNFLLGIVFLCYVASFVKQ